MAPREKSPSRLAREQSEKKPQEKRGRPRTREKPPVDAALTPSGSEAACNPTPAASPPALSAEPSFSRPWMKVWVEAASRTGCIATACTEARVTFLDYRDGRLTDLVFDEACRVHDELVDLRITESLRLNAMGGDVRSQSLYFTRVRSMIFLGSKNAVAVHGLDGLPSSVAEAMIRAGLAPPRSGASPCPPRRTSRPRPISILDSEAEPIDV